MIRAVATVPTQALQLWFRPSEFELGWPHVGVTVSGYPAPFDTYASMSHLLDLEDWPDDDRPGSLAYLCSVLPESTAQAPQPAREVVRSNAQEFLRASADRFWPGVRTADGDFCWDLLCGEVPGKGADRLDGQYWSANTDPSDRYVQSLPGSGAFRLQADQSGYENLVLAGDWINCGLNAGCVEAAVMAGHEAGNVVRRRPVTEGLLGAWYGVSG
jgi:uncharacterized protein with NAD-binding domain and iron-sulfur cluster